MYWIADVRLAEIHIQIADVGLRAIVLGVGFAVKLTQTLLRLDFLQEFVVRGIAVLLWQDVEVFRGVALASDFPLVLFVVERREVCGQVVAVDFHDAPIIQSHETQRMRRPAVPLVSDLVLRRMRVNPRDVVFIKGVIEASEGLAVVFSEGGGDLVIATPPSQKEALDLTLRDLQEETGALLD